ASRRCLRLGSHGRFGIRSSSHTVGTGKSSSSSSSINPPLYRAQPLFLRDAHCVAFLQQCSSANGTAYADGCSLVGARMPLGANRKVVHALNTHTGWGYREIWKKILAK